MEKVGAAPAATDAVVIQVNDNLNKLLLDSPGINVEEEEESYERASIYRIPHFMREVQAKAFEPQLVSFGPYHHGRSHLVSMELEKLKAFQRFKSSYGLRVESIVMSVWSILDALMGSYDKLEDEWKKSHPEKFLQVMVVDGCFMLEFFEDCPESLRNMSGDIKRDMLLLENQLPMKLLRHLYSMTNVNDQQPTSQDQENDLKSLICNSMCIQENEVMPQCLHILDMYKSSLLYPPIDKKDRSGRSGKGNETSDSECQIIPPATQLHEAGIVFEQSKTWSFTDVSFDPKRGVLTLPRVVVDDDTEAMLLNTMAFEKLHIGAGRKVTSFVILMNNLVDADKDVALLASERILTNALGNNQGAAELFSLLGKGAAMDLDSNITSVYKMVNEHCNHPWNEWFASLKHDYFQNPWAVISLVAAFLGFAILILQAVYQIIDYY